MHYTCILPTETKPSDSCASDLGKNSVIALMRILINPVTTNI